jgi:hypothetical protein
VREKRDTYDVVRELVRTLVESFASGPRLRRAMVRMVWRMDHYESIVEAMRESAERNALMLARFNDPRLRPPNPAMMFVASRAVMGVIRNASIEKSPLLGTPEFEEELVRMVWGLLKRD